LLIKYIKSVLWRVAKCLSYIEEARCLKVKGFRGCNLQKLLLWIKTCFFALGMRSEVNAPKNGERTVSFSFTTMFLHTGQRFLSRAQYVNTGASPILSWPGRSWFLPVPSTEISIEWDGALWCYWHH